MRHFLATAALAACPLAAFAAFTSDYQMTVDAPSNLDYSLTSVSSLDVYGGQLPANDPTINLQIGKRYQIQNVLPDEHPIQIIAKGLNPVFDFPLLGEGATEGMLENDSEINWIDNNAGIVEFTVTQGLVDAMHVEGRTPGYRCELHSGNMRGDFAIQQANGPSDDATVVFANLNDTQWETQTIPGVFREPGFATTGGLAIAANKDPNFAFGLWQTKSALQALPAGRHTITFTLSNTPPPASPDRQPEFRFRVFTADNSYSALGVTTQTGGSIARDTIEVVYTSDGTTPFRVAIDLLAGADQAGGTTVTAITDTPLN